MVFLTLLSIQATTLTLRLKSKGIPEDKQKTLDNISDIYLQLYAKGGSDVVLKQLEVTATAIIQPLMMSDLQMQMMAST